MSPVRSVTYVSGRSQARVSGASGASRREGAIRITTEFGLHLDSTEALFREKNWAKYLKNCGGQGRT